MKLQYICLYLCTLHIMSCSNPYASDIKQSLVLAGDNASELQAIQVLVIIRYLYMVMIIMVMLFIWIQVWVCHIELG